MPNEAYDAWVKSTFDVDPSRYAADGPTPNDAAPAAGTTPPAAPTTAPPSPAGPDDPRKAILASIATIHAEAKFLKDAGVDSSPIETEAAKLQTRLDATDKLADTPQRQADFQTLAADAKTALDRAVADGKRQVDSTGTGMTAAIKDLRDGAEKQITALAADNPKKPDFTKRLADLDTDIAALAKAPAGPQSAAQRKTVNTKVETLLDDVTAVSPDKQATELIYAKALTDRYGFQTGNDPGMTNPHFDRVYKMFEKVPVDHVVQDKLKNLNFTRATASGDYDKAVIRIRDYDDSATSTYINPKTGQQEKYTWLNTISLHELGHSVDDRFGIMATHMARDSGGGWKVETLDSVAQALTTDFMVAGDGRTLGIDTAKISGFIKSALAGSAVGRPDDIPQEKWTPVTRLLGQIAAMKDGTKPWRSPVNVGGRVFLESYPGKWNSCSWAVRSNAGISVSVYQWRAPGEWFAELYAYSWFNSAAAPSGVDPGIAAYLWTATGDSAGKPTA